MQTKSQVYCFSFCVETCTRRNRGRGRANCKCGPDPRELMFCGLTIHPWNSLRIELSGFTNTYIFHRKIH